MASCLKLEAEKRGIESSECLTVIFFLYVCFVKSYRLVEINKYLKVLHILIPVG